MAITLNGTSGISSPGGDTSTSLATTNLSYTGTLTGGTGVIAIGTNQIYKDASGNVGIGTSSPTSRLSVAGSTPSIQISGTGGTAAFYQATSAGVQDWSFGCRTTGKFVINNGNVLAGTDVVTIDTSGSFLVGTTGPAMSFPKLDVSGARATDGVVQFENSVNTSDVNHGILNLINTATGAAGNDARIMFSFRQVGATTGLDPMASLGAIKEAGSFAAAIQFNTRSATGVYSEKARIDSSGRLLVNATSSTANSHQINQIADNVYACLFRTTTVTAGASYGIGVTYGNQDPNGTGNEFIQCYGTTTQRFAVRSNGGIANFSANNVNLASDRRLKNTIEPVKSYWGVFKNLDWVTWLYNEQTDNRKNIGVIAQDLQILAPELVCESGREAPEGEESYLGLFDQDFKMASMSVITQLVNRVEELTTRLEALESK